MRFWTFALFLPLAACATVPPAPTPPPTVPPPPPPLEVQILAINDFHGNLEPPQNAIVSKDASGAEVRVPAGGVAYLAGALKQLRQGQPFSITVAAGDLIGATPITSALFLDEPTILALNLAGLDLASVGNHEFDKGAAELKRMQTGGCAKLANREPCAVDKDFPGAKFNYLAANVATADGATLFPAASIREFGPIKIGFIGMTLRETGTLVTPSGVAGLTFADEAATANALVPQLKAQGADAIVVLLHQGAFTKGAWSDKSCPGLSGDVLPILDKLDPAIELVVSGHTHWAYTCELPMPNGKTRLLTSSGRYGTMLTDIRLTFHVASETLTSKKADLTVVQGEGFSNTRGASPIVPSFPVYPADPAVRQLVDRYKAAAQPIADRTVAKLARPMIKAEDPDRASRAAELVADAQQHWTRTRDRGGAQIGFMNNTGIRTDLAPRPDGTVTYGQAFAMQPFGNGIVVMDLTGAQLKRLLEQQFTDVKEPMMLMPSAGFRFSYDVRRPEGERIVSMSLNGRPVDRQRTYRVATNSFLAAGGDSFTVFTEGTNRVDAGNDLDALEAYLKSNPKLPTGGRVKSLFIVDAPSKP
jgi:5'-nucleotidase